MNRFDHCHVTCDMRRFVLDHLLALVHIGPWSEGRRRVLDVGPAGDV
jgi:hypothetical protein